MYNNCGNTVYKGPNSSDVKTKIFTDDKGNQYRLTPVVYVCPQCS